MKRGQFSAAARKLERSAELDVQPGTLLNLALCYEQLGRAASAWSTYRRAATVAARRGDRREQRARDAAARLEPRLVRMGIRVFPRNRVPGLVVRRDGKEIASDLFGETFPIDPGKTRVVASAPGRVRWEKVVDASPSSGIVWVDVPKLARSARQVSVAPPTPAGVHAESASRPQTSEPTGDASLVGLPRAAEVAGIIALVEFAGAIGLATAAVATDRAADSRCMPAGCDARGITLRKRAFALSTASAWVAAAGGITLGFAVGVVWGDRTSDSSAAWVRFPSGASLGVATAWP
jgi:hypothetical protein